MRTDEGTHTNTHEQTHTNTRVPTNAYKQAHTIKYEQMRTIKTIQTNCTNACTYTYADERIQQSAKKCLQTDAYK